MTDWYMVDIRYLAGFLALSFAAAFGVARFLRNASAQREQTAWERATSTHYEGMGDVLGASESQRLAVAEVEEQCRIAAEKGRVVP